MITVEEAKALIIKHTSPLEPQTVGLANAAGYILAQDIYARFDIPAFPQSSMDGYALRYRDKDGELLVCGEMAAGTPRAFQIKTGECARIFTGAPLPEGADTVVMQEKVILEDGKITLQDGGLQPGSNVRARGAEVKAETLAIEKGSDLSPAAIGFLAGIGIAELSVLPMARVTIIITGAELIKPGTELFFGQVYESNSYSLSAALKAEGLHNLEVLYADDDLNVLTQVLETALSTSDMVLLTGGVSVGDYDFVIEATKKCGVEQIFHKVKQKPGKPLYFGRKKNTLVFGLPGNPSSVLSCYYNYVLPALKLLSGKKTNVKELSARLSDSYSKPKGLTHFLKGSYNDGVATPLNAQESFRLSSFAQANCLICLEQEKENFEAGNSVTIFLLPD
nr:gephyrin-like molybdotransferase Glp [Pedobacter panaciterrae]